MVCCSLDCASSPASFSVNRDNSSSLPLGLCEDTYIKGHWNTKYYNDMGELGMKIWRDWVTCSKIKHYCLVAELGGSSWIPTQALSHNAVRARTVPLIWSFSMLPWDGTKQHLPSVRFKESAVATQARVPEEISVSWGRKISAHALYSSQKTMATQCQVKCIFQNQAKVRINGHFSK